MLRPLIAIGCAPERSRSYRVKEEWRLDLKVGSQIDGRDKELKWFTCKVVAVDYATKQVKISYDGWSSKWDEWLYRHDIRIQPHLSIAKDDGTHIYDVSHKKAQIVCQIP